MEDEASSGEPEREDEEDAGIVGEALDEALEKEGEGGGDGKKEEEEKEEGQSEVSKAGANDKDENPFPSCKKKIIGKVSTI